MSVEEPASEHKEGAGAGGIGRLEGALYLAEISNLERDQLPASRSGHGLRRVPTREVGPVPQDCHRRCARLELFE